MVPKSHYQVVYDTLNILWARAVPILWGLAVALALALIALVLIGPRYTGQATIQFNFVREEPATGSKLLPTATIDPIAVVDSAAPIVRSRATANAVVTRLGLDKDPVFARGSHLWRLFSGIRSLLGFKEAAISNHDLAEDQLMRQIAVTIDPRSYLMSISVTAADPDRAARLANAVALEYLRGQLQQQLTDAYAAAERQMVDLSAIYGIRHPAYQSEQLKLERLHSRLRELREEPFDEAAASRVAGQSFVAAQKVVVPSGPNILLVLGLTAIAELGIGAWLALQPWSNPWPNIGWRNALRRIRPALVASPLGGRFAGGRFAIPSEWTLASVRKLMRTGEKRTSDHVDVDEHTTDQALG
jgi:uncharacterized protein involved in exopolysaccharide biosynthesis